MDNTIPENWTLQSSVLSIRGDTRVAYQVRDRNGKVVSGIAVADGKGNFVADIGVFPLNGGALIMPPAVATEGLLTVKLVDSNAQVID